MGNPTRTRACSRPVTRRNVRAKGAAPPTVRGGWGRPFRVLGNGSRPHSGAGTNTTGVRLWRSQYRPIPPEFSGELMLVVPRTSSSSSGDAAKPHVVAATNGDGVDTREPGGAGPGALASAFSGRTEIPGVSTRERGRVTVLPMSKPIASQP